MINIPKSQILWVTHCDSDNKPKQIITSDQLRNKYYLYNVDKNGTLIKIETANQPLFKKDMFN